jgi:hypothetical protein
MESRSIGVTTRVNDVLRDHPRTGEIFIQYGRLSVAEPGNLYLQYPHETVGEFAQRNGADREALLHQLNAVAEATELDARGLTPRPTGRGRPPEQPIGYTGAYRDLNDTDIETQPFVASLLSRGPE